MIRYSFQFLNPHTAATQNFFSATFSINNVTRTWLAYMKCWYEFFETGGPDSSVELEGSVTLRSPTFIPLGEVANNLTLSTGTVFSNNGNPFCTSFNDFVGIHELALGETSYALNCSYRFPVNYAVPAAGGNVFLSVYMVFEQQSFRTSLMTHQPEVVLHDVLTEG